MIAFIALSTRFIRQIERSAARALALSAEAARHAAMLLRRRRTWIALSRLDDRTLHDIGLNRTMIMSVAADGGRTARQSAARRKAAAEAVASIERLRSRQLKELSLKTIRSAAEGG